MLTFQGQPASDDLEAARNGTTPQDPSDNTASPDTLEKGATPSSPNQTVSVGESVTSKKTQVTETCKEEERHSATAPESDTQPCSEAAPGSNLAVYTTPPSSAPASDKLTEASPDISTEDSPDAVPPATDKPRDIHSGPISVSSLISTKETDSTAPESSEQTPQQCGSVAKQSVSEQDKDKITSHEAHNLSVRPDDNENHTNTEQHDQADRKENQAARDKRRCYTDDPNTKNTEHSADPCSVTKETAQNTEVVISQIHRVLTLKLTQIHGVVDNNHECRLLTV